MSKPVVVVFTATSNTGYAAITHINTKFNDQVTIRAVVRSKNDNDIPDDKDLADELAEMGIEVVCGDIKKTRSLGAVFAGATGAYFATPTTEDRVKCVKNFVDMCFEHGVGNAVIISMCGTDDEKQSTQYHKQFAQIEEYAMSKSGQPVKLAMADKGKRLFCPTIIRSPPFYQNFYGSLAGIQQGMLYYPLGDSTVTHVDFNDVGKAIAHVLVNPAPHAGKSYNIVGETQAGNSLAGAIAMKAGVPCVYQNVDDEIVVMAFEVLGLQKWLAEGNVEMLRYIREGGLDDIEKGDFEKITGSKPAKFGDFVKTYLKPMIAADDHVPWAHWTRNI